MGIILEAVGRGGFFVYSYTCSKYDVSFQLFIRSNVSSVSAPTPTNQILDDHRIIVFLDVRIYYTAGRLRCLGRPSSVPSTVLYPPPSPLFCALHRMRWKTINGETRKSDARKEDCWAAAVAAGTKAVTTTAEAATTMSATGGSRGSSRSSSSSNGGRGSSRKAL